MNDFFGSPATFYQIGFIKLATSSKPLLTHEQSNIEQIIKQGIKQKVLESKNGMDKDFKVVFASYEDGKEDIVTICKQICAAIESKEQKTDVISQEFINRNLCSK
jgi:undecaprenyl pyrophosphate synthase